MSYRNWSNKSVLAHLCLWNCTVALTPTTPPPQPLPPPPPPLFKMQDIQLRTSLLKLEHLVNYCRKRIIYSQQQELKYMMNKVEVDFAIVKQRVCFPVSVVEKYHKNDIMGTVILTHYIILSKLSKWKWWVSKNQAENENKQLKRVDWSLPALIRCTFV